MKKSLALFTGLVAIAALSCSQLPKVPGGGPAAPVKPDPPNIKISAVALVSAPTNTSLAKYFCPQVANALACRVFGAAPAAADLKFVFDATLNVQNPNKVPLPAVETMVAFTAYPGTTGQANVGAVCIALCPEGEACGAPPADGCSDAGSLKSMNDYASAAVGFLANVALGNTQPSDVKVRTIGAGESVDVKVRLELNPEAMLKLMANVASDTLAQVKQGKKPAFTIPYSLEGTLWVNVESFGKIAAGFGPLSDTWALTE